ncbi:hypothetical protein Ngar_c29830 [Candidatus Nitrososphaera gargensis Ga9.2]|uniref:Uncharacterized protein n=1 Tax=Nitrososphaera gargensis (strain Ga9.2) TaxID=1237085 RepID=K0IEW7_NITGG|nr:hypothetical protein [Candidatus Nitrososphaera gargensis]AFU59901.1 hypothetical protein Ngar_c29830 [Candidatus Nitrososphaera gargensis Ga9.2]
MFVVLTHEQLKSVVEGAPPLFGKDAARYRYDVVFLKEEPLTTKVAMKSVAVKDGIDRAYEGEGMLYFSRLMAKAAQSRLMKNIRTSYSPENDHAKLQYHYKAARSDGQEGGDGQK